MGGFNIDFSRIFSILNDERIDRKELFKLVDIAKSLDLENEENIREVIKQVALVAHKSIDGKTEDAIVEKIKKEGLSPSLLDFL